MPRAFGRRMRKKRGPDKLDFADISLMLLAAHKKNIFDEKDAELSKEEKISDVACFCKKDDKVRFHLIQMYLNPWFDRLVIFLIFANSITLCFSDPMDVDPASPLNRTLNTFEIIFNVLFSLESAVKIVAMGPKLYFNDGWNRLDFIVVVLGWAPSILELIYFDSGGSGININLSAVRAIRALKILRTANSIDGMKQIVGGILSAIPNLANVLYLTVFVFAVFGLIFVKLYGGKLRQRCFYKTFNSTGNNMTTWTPDFDNRVCSMQPNIGFQCPKGQICSYENPVTHALNPSNPNNYVNFDTFLFGCLTVFQIITLEGWVDIMYDIQDAAGILHFIFFVFLVIIGAFFMVNLVVGVIFENYNNAIEESQKEKEEQVRNVAAKEVVTTGTQINKEKKVLDALLKKPAFQSPKRPSNNAQKQTDKKKAVELTVIKEEENEEETEARIDIPKISRPPLGLSVAPERVASQEVSNLKEKILRIIDNKVFQDGIMVLILMNTVVLALEHDDSTRINEPTGMTPEFILVLDGLNQFFSYVFLLEMILKHIGYGIKKYWSEPMDAFDGIIVLVSMIDIVFSSMGSSEGTNSFGGFISVFRAFRLLRVFKLIRRWPRLQEILRAVMKSASGLLNFSILLFVVMVIYALVGMEFFGNKYEVNGLETPRANFNSLPFALITVFQVLTGENWNDVLHFHMDIDGITSVFFFVSLFCVGNYVLMNVFLAILLENFSNEEYVEEMEKHALEEEKRRLSLIEAANNARISNIEKNNTEKSTTEENNAEEGSKEENDKEKKDIWAKEKVPRRKVTSLDLIGLDGMESAKYAKKIKKVETRRNEGKKMRTGTSLGFFTAEHPIRKKCIIIARSNRFETCILCLIIISSILLAIDEPHLDENGPTKQVLYVLDLIFTVIFLGEAIIKIIAYGFYWGEHTYLKDSWNVLDFGIVLVSLINLILSSLSLRDIGFLKTLRVLRALRPLRVAKRLEGIKRVIGTIAVSMPAIGNVLMIALLFLLIFSILGVQLFSGRLYFCKGEEADRYTRSLSNCAGTYVNAEGKNVTRTWIVPPANFDNVVYAMVTLFGVTTLEMWPDTMYVYPIYFFLLYTTKII